MDDLHWVGLVVANRLKWFCIGCCYCCTLADGGFVCWLCFYVFDFIVYIEYLTEYLWANTRKSDLHIIINTV